MIKDNPFKLIWGAWAIAIYVAIIGLLLIYFNTRSDDKSKHFVKKDEHRIQVALSAPQKAAKPKQTTPTRKPKIKPKIKQKPKHKKRSKKPVKKERIKKKAVKKRIKKEDQNRTRPKKEKLSNLFANVKPHKKSMIEVTDKPVTTDRKSDLIKVTEKPMSASQRISSSLKIQKSSDSGIENAYFAKVEEKLKGWPAQSDYAGEKAKVWLRIAPSGYFEFKVLSASNNEAFNSGLAAYLKQLQRFGFGAHRGTRPYEIEVEFIATE